MYREGCLECPFFVFCVPNSDLPFPLFFLDDPQPDPHEKLNEKIQWKYDRQRPADSERKVPKKPGNKRADGLGPVCNQQVGGSSPSTSSTSEQENRKYGGVPEWPKGADCKSVGTAFSGSNPLSPNPLRSGWQAPSYSLQPPWSARCRTPMWELRW